VLAHNCELPGGASAFDRTEVATDNSVVPVAVPLYVLVMLLSLEKDVQYIICDLLTVYTILVTSHNAEFTEELLESGILEIVVKRLISSIDATETQQIVQFIHSLQAKVQKKTAFALRLTKAGLRTTWNSANANYEFYGEIYKHPR
jgi:hypothetical protein